MSILSILAGFLNNNGGTLIVGLSDDGYPTNLRDDNFANEDEMSLYLVDLVKERMGSQALLSIHVNFDDYNGNRIMLVRCTRAQVPIFVEDVDVKRFFIRTGSLTIELDAEQIEEYLARRESFAKT
jgi:predicted HTH transcriptional regulator